MRRHGSDLLLALLLGLALGRWLLPAPAGGTRPAESTGPQAPLVVGTGAVASRAAHQAEALAPELERAEAYAGLGFDGAARLAELPLWLDQLSRRADGGEPAALEQLAHWADYCERAKGAAAMQRYGGPAALDLADPEVHQWFAGLIPVCAQWLENSIWLQELKTEIGAVAAAQRAGTGGTDPKLARTLAQALLQRAQAAGDFVARIRGDDPKLRPQCPPGSTPACRTDFQRRQLEAALATRDPRVIAAVGELGYRMGMSTTHSRYFPFDVAQRETLWNLAACELGLPCGPEHPSVQLACLAGICGYRDYPSYAYDQRLTPAGRRAVEGQLPTLVASLRAGDIDALMR